MITEKVMSTLAQQLQLMLEPRFRGIKITVEHSPRWNRPCATFRWEGFGGLLPEERFHRLAGAIPESFRESKLKSFVWVELAPGESIDEFLKMPRSEDVAKNERNIHERLVNSGFFEVLRKKLGPQPKKKCGGDFSLAVEALTAQDASATAIRDAKLLFIRHGAYCDCQVADTVAKALAEE